MPTHSMLAVTVAALLLPATASAQGAKPNDAQIAHVAYTAGAIDISAARQALTKSKNPEIRSFAEEMVRDHTAVNKQATALAHKLKVTPQDNPTSQGLKKDADAKLASYAKLSGPAFDRAYIQNEVAFHKTVNTALKGTLIPDAKNAELKALLESGLKVFQEHETHAEQIAAKVK